MLLGSCSLVVALQLQLLRGTENSCFNSEGLNLSFQVGNHTARQRAMFITAFEHRN